MFRSVFRFLSIFHLYFSFVCPYNYPIISPSPASFSSLNNECSTHTTTVYRIQYTHWKWFTCCVHSAYVYLRSPLNFHTISMRFSKIQFLLSKSAFLLLMNNNPIISNIYQTFQGRQFIIECDFSSLIFHINTLSYGSIS